MKNVIKYNMFLIVFFSFLSLANLFFPGLARLHIQTYAAESTNNRAYLYFYTVNGEEIDELTKKISKKKEYLFPDPDQYKYLPIEDGDEYIYPELYYQVTGIHWEEKDSDGNAIREYKAGDKFEFSSGDHYFYVKSDNPVLTGENTIDLKFDEQAHLYFCNVDEDEIYSLEKHISAKDEFTFPDPEQYAYLFESGEDSEGEMIESDTYSGKGVYWRCVDDNDKEYLFAKGDTCKFKPGEYYFYAKTDDPVTVNFFYPIDYDTYYCVDVSAGEIYDSFETKIGQTITLKRSLGAILWESTFRGWETEDGKRYSGGVSYRIMDNQNQNFFAVYEYDENWNPNAKDENTDNLPKPKEDEELIVDINAVNEAAGAGYGAYIDANGILQHAGGNQRINSSTNIRGITGRIQTEKTLSPLKSGVDTSDPASYNDPNNYKFDKYGRKMEESTLEPEINNVLKQDDSAMYMDVYGNAFVYYSQLSRKSNMLLAYDRLTAGKTDSWVKNVSEWDAEMIKRFEAIEFALLYGTYPSDGQELVPGVVWKNSYMSKKAFDRLVSYKQMWSGWLDQYDDGLLDKYKSENGGNGGGIIVGRHTINNPFIITAYAADENGVGKTNQNGSRINLSQDFNDTKFKPLYYDPTRMYNFGSYRFSGLDGLTQENIAVLQKVFQTLIEYGFTEEAAAGACGNIWQESNFNPKALSSTGTYHGLVQWGGQRFQRLNSYAIQNGSTWDNADIQIGFIKQELNSGYLQAMNRELKKYTGESDIRTVQDVQTACDIWAVAVEGCICSENHPESQCPKVNGKPYQELASRREKAQKIYHAMTRSALTIDPNGFSVPNNGSNNKVPYLPQSGTAPWVTKPFGGGNIASSGCSVASLSMVISYLSGEWVYPSDIVDAIAEKYGNYNHFYVAPAGQSHSIFPAVANMYGFSCSTISGAAAIHNSLINGYPVIMSCKPGEFTSKGHFIVITGTDGNGNYFVNDPNGRHNDKSYKTYTLNFLISQGKGWWTLK